MCAFFVATAVERGDQLAGDLGGFLKYGVGGIGVDVVGQGWQPGPECGGFEDFVQDKAHIAQGGVEFRHEKPRFLQLKAFCGSGFARDLGAAACLGNRSDTFASKLAPTVGL